jgi:hypothetical protein
MLASCLSVALSLCLPVSLSLYLSVSLGDDPHSSVFESFKLGNDDVDKDDDDDDDDDHDDDHNSSFYSPCGRLHP